MGDCCCGSQPPLVAHAKCWQRFLQKGAQGSKTKQEPANWRQPGAAQSGSYPGLCSPCQVLRVSRSRNWGHHSKDIYELLSATVVPRDFNEVQHPGVCRVLVGMAGDAPAPSLKGRADQGLVKKTRCSQCSFNRMLPGNSSSNTLVCPGHSRKGEVHRLGEPGKASHGNMALSCASRKLDTGTKWLCILPREQQGCWPQSLTQAAGKAAANPVATDGQASGGCHI